MRRRDVIGLIGAAAAWSFAARAQAPAMSLVAAHRSRPRDTDVQLEIALAATRLELLHELVPTAATIATLVNPDLAEEQRQLGHEQEAASRIGFELLILKAGSESDLDKAFAELVRRGASALLIGDDMLINGRLDDIVALAARYEVPTMYAQRDVVAAGGLMSYGVGPRAVRRDPGTHAGGAPAAGQASDLLVIQAANIELAINLKTATALGLKIPQALLARADEVIE